VSTVSSGTMKLAPHRFADLRFFSWIPTVRGEGGCSDRRWPGASKSLALSEPDFVATLASLVFR
jgi:hypothetical protein